MEIPGLDGFVTYLITPTRRSKKLEEKREGQHYKLGQVIASTTKHKA